MERGPGTCGPQGRQDYAAEVHLDAGHRVGLNFNETAPIQQSVRFVDGEYLKLTHIFEQVPGFPHLSRLIAVHQAEHDPSGEPPEPGTPNLRIPVARRSNVFLRPDEGTWVIDERTHTYNSPFIQRGGYDPQAFPEFTVARPEFGDYSPLLVRELLDPQTWPQQVQ